VKNRIGDAQLTIEFLDRYKPLEIERDGLQYQLVLFQVYHTFVLPHTSLRQSLAEPIPTHGSGSAKVWRPCTPAMAALSGAAVTTTADSLTHGAE
jgi:hypothetical protein